MSDPPLFLVDGHNLLWIATMGSPATITSRDRTRTLTGVFKFFAVLRKAIRESVPAAPEVLVIFDGEHGSAERKQADAGYKAHRPIDTRSRSSIYPTCNAAWMPSVSRGSKSTTPKPTT